MVLPKEYIVQKFYQLAGYPKTKQQGKVIEGGCPICKEGKSWGRKRRLYLIIPDNIICCHNCGWYGNPIKFIQETEGLEYKQIIAEAEEYDILPQDISLPKTNIFQTKEAPSLPRDSINLCDPSQITYYSNDNTVTRVHAFANDRKLLTAVNRPKTLWVSLTDNVHKNRLILPFYNTDGDIEFYQTRTVFPGEKLPKYLSKIGGDKTFFNINNIDPSLDNVFIFEGPIDACFVENGIAVAGIQENSNKSFSVRQQEQLNGLTLLNKIWVLDSQWLDTASKTKTHSLLEQGHNVFIWPKEYGSRFKDFNDMAIALDVNEIPYKFILENTYTGLKGQVVLSNIS